MITAEGLRPQEGMAETWEGEAPLDYPVGQLEDADAASEEQICAGLQHSTTVALALGAKKGKWVKHPLDRRCETQRAHGREGQVILRLMLDTFLLLAAARIWHHILAFLSRLWFRMQHSSRVYLALGVLDVWSPGLT